LEACSTHQQCVYVCMHMCVCMHMSVFVCVYVYTCVCIYVKVWVSMCACVCVYLLVCARALIYRHWYANFNEACIFSWGMMYVCMYVCVCVCLYFVPMSVCRNWCCYVWCLWIHLKRCLHSSLYEKQCVRSVHMWVVSFVNLLVCRGVCDNVCLDDCVWETAFVCLCSSI